MKDYKCRLQIKNALEHSWIKKYNDSNLIDLKIAESNKNDSAMFKHYAFRFGFNLK